MNLFLAVVVDKIPMSDALILSLIGFMVVFFILVVLMAAIKIITAFVNLFEQQAVAAEGPAPVAAIQAPDKNAGKVPAPGSLGECDLHGVCDHDAAMLMAIVADEMKSPLNELRFISIKEVGKE